jgi:hypothetical protein
MVDIIEITLDVDIHKPLGSRPKPLDTVKGRVYRFLWSKSV